MGPEVPGVGAQCLFATSCHRGRLHAKNFSFLIGVLGRASLAPLYDLASALPYPGHNAPRLKLAMKIGGESRLHYVRMRHWERFGAQVGLPPEEVLGICESVATETPDRLADIVAAARSEGLDHPITAAIAVSHPNMLLSHVIPAEPSVGATGAH